MSNAKPLKEMSGFSTVLVICEAQKILDNTVEIIRELLKTHDSGVFITVNQPYKAIKNVLSKNKIKTDKLFFIDCITKTAVEKAEKSDDCLYISSPSALTELGMSVTEALSTLKGDNKFVFIDSLGTFLIYNSSGSISKFSHFLITKMSIMGVDGIFMSVEKEMDAKLITELQSFCQKTIRLK
jgi:hypothetical protein